MRASYCIFITLSRTFYVAVMPAVAAPDNFLPVCKPLPPPPPPPEEPKPKLVPYLHFGQFEYLIFENAIPRSSGQFYLGLLVAFLISFFYEALQYLSSRTEKSWEVFDRKAAESAFGWEDDLPPPVRPSFWSRIWPSRRNQEPNNGIIGRSGVGRRLNSSEAADDDDDEAGPSDPLTGQQNSPPPVTLAARIKTFAVLVGRESTRRTTRLILRVLGSTLLVAVILLVATFNAGIISAPFVPAYVFQAAAAPEKREAVTETVSSASAFVETASGCLALLTISGLEAFQSHDVNNVMEHQLVDVSSSTLSNILELSARYAGDVVYVHADSILLCFQNDDGGGDGAQVAGQRAIACCAELILEFESKLNPSPEPEDSNFSSSYLAVAPPFKIRALVDFAEFQHVIVGSTMRYEYGISHDIDFEGLGHITQYGIDIHKSGT
ncbi:hypothetical protein HDU97_007202 [Phlyctochytrium planicorne]|nr:hypothetical protein HDU97_007202 [Phlyctochytrium planicorne]